MAAAFDTLKYAKQLKQVGVPEDQAEIHAEALRGVLEEQIMVRFDRIDDRFDQVDQRFAQVDRAIADLKAGMVRLEGKFDSLEERTKGRFTLLQWMLAFNLALTAAVLYKLF